MELVWGLGILGILGSSEIPWEIIHGCSIATGFHAIFMWENHG